MPYRFEWDSRQAATNIRKHGVSFDEASTVFDPADEIQPAQTEKAPQGLRLAEVRELIIGHSVAGRLLLVGFTERPGERLRLISARMATSKERQDYEDNRNA
jgi:uncharacterized DUF497 family protein